MTDQAAREEHWGRLDEIHRLRGVFLSEMADVEGNLDFLICLFFHVPAEQRQIFTSWVLSGTSLSDKIEIVAKATRSSHPDSTMKDVVSRLRELKNARNTVAHAGVSLDITKAIQRTEDILWASTRWTRSGPRQEVLTADGLQQLVRSATEMAATLFAVMDAMVRAPDRLVPLDRRWGPTYDVCEKADGSLTVSKELILYIHNSTTEIEVDVPGEPVVPPS